MEDFFVELSSFGTGIFGSPVALPWRETAVVKHTARRDRIHSTYPNQHNGRPQWGRRSERDDMMPAACGRAIVGTTRHSLTHSTAPRNNEQQLFRVIARKKSRAGV